MSGGGLEGEILGGRLVPPPRGPLEGSLRTPYSVLGSDSGLLQGSGLFLCRLDYCPSSQRQKRKGLQLLASVD